MGYAVDQLPVWPFTPDWSTPVTETLGWLTDGLRAKTGAEQVRALRDVPRRGFSFMGAAAGDERRIIDALRFDIGVRPVALPIYPDVQWLGAPLAAGATEIPCRTTGFDFSAGGRALLWQDVRNWELVDVDAVGADHLAFAAPTAAAYGPGARLYPVRRARLADVPKATHLNDETSTIDAQFLIDEWCDWPAAWPTATTYRGVPVIEWRNEESEDPTDQYDRLSDTVDADVGKVFYFDLPGRPFRAQSQRFALDGRAAHSKFRALAYQLAGRAAQCWVPSWQADVRLAAPIASNATQISVPWIGYTQFGYPQANRRDLAIELCDGTRLYRRVTGSAETGDGEVLQVDSKFGVAVDPSNVRQIGWLSVCAAASDTIAIEHATDADGSGTATINWQAVRSDV